MDLTASAQEKMERIARQIAELHHKAQDSKDQDQIDSIEAQIHALKGQSAQLEKGIVKLTQAPSAPSKKHEML